MVIKCWYIHAPSIVKFHYFYRSFCHKSQRANINHEVHCNICTFSKVVDEYTHIRLQTIVCFCISTIGSLSFPLGLRCRYKYYDHPVHSSFVILTE